MKLSARVACILATLFTGSAVSAEAEACDCKPPWPTKKALDHATVVFEGRAGAMVEDEDGERRTTRFEVQRVFKGETCTPLKVLTHGRISSCAKSYKPGETYLIYAYTGRNDSELFDGFCSRSKLSADAKEDFAGLPKGTPPSCEVDLDAPPPKGEAVDKPEPDVDGVPPKQPVATPSEPEPLPEHSASGLRTCAATVSGSEPAIPVGVLCLLLAGVRRRTSTGV